MNDSDTPLNSCFGALFVRKGSKKNITPKRAKLPVSGSSVSSNSPSFEKGENISHFGPCCGFSFGQQQETWDHHREDLPSYSPEPLLSGAKDAATIIDHVLDDLNSPLRDLSLKIHSHPEIRFHENYAHDLLTTFMESHGFQVTKHYLMNTAWRAEFSQGKNGRVIGVNSEMDALVGLGHACGHNLIAISGVGVALALKAALQAHPNVSGKVVLLGTPGEEGGGGKVTLLKRGAYDDMDACIMCHPAPGPPNSIGTGTTNALQQICAEYSGQSAHAGAAPWEGTNALDAAFLAYSGISALRQQIKPDHRVHGMVEGKNWSPNVIPDYAKMTWMARTSSHTELASLVERVKNCFLAGALGTGCQVQFQTGRPYYELKQNPILAQYFTDIAGSRYGMIDCSQPSAASTDFGNVTFALPGLHPHFAIPTEPNGGNHTPGFEKAAGTMAAHEATMQTTRVLAILGFHVLTDDVFYGKVRESFEKSKSTTLDA